MAPQRRKGKPGSTDPSRSKNKSRGNKVKSVQGTPFFSYISKVIITNLAVAVIATGYYYYQSYYGASTASTTPQTNYTNGELSGESAIFTVVDLPGKGKGLVAARDIHRSDILLIEQPLFSVPFRINSNTSPAAIIASQIEALSPKQQEAFFNLSYVNFPSHLDPSEHPDEVALAIFQTNAVSVGENAAIFPSMARLNHGCSSAFNAVYMWREKEGLLYVHALKDIPKGRELLTTYTNLRKPRDERRAYLSQQYGFHCTCEVCSLPDDLSKASDERLAAISAHYEAFATWGAEKMEGLEAITHIHKIWQLEEEEGYWSERGQLAADATWIAAAHSDAIATQAWAKLAVEWYSYEIGGDAPQVGVMRAVEARPQAHKAWGTRAPLEVGGPDS